MLARERFSQPVEHVIEGICQHTYLVALPVLVDTWGEVPGVHARGHRRHAAQWARHMGADQIRAEQRTCEREDAGEDEGARDALLSVRDWGQGLANSDHDSARG